MTERGGQDLLHSKERLYQLLGRGTRHVVVPDEGKELFVVKFAKDEIGEMKLLLQKGSIEAKRLPPDAVTDAIKRSFAADERDPLPPREQCYLSGNSFIELLDMGFPIDEAEFLRDDEWNGRKRRHVYHYHWRFL